MGVLPDAIGRDGRESPAGPSSAAGSTGSFALPSSAPAGAPTAPARSTPPAAGSPAPSPDVDGRTELRRRRDALAEQVTELHWDLGGLAYEMAIRDHFRLDVLVRRAALLQERDAELAEVERLLAMEDTATIGDCSQCGAPHSRGAVFCWQCGVALMERSAPVSAGPDSAGTASATAYEAAGGHIAGAVAVGNSTGGGSTSGSMAGGSTSGSMADGSAAARSRAGDSATDGAADVMDGLLAPSAPPRGGAVSSPGASSRAASPADLRPPTAPPSTPDH